jgi:hypothetical protein
MSIQVQLRRGSALQNSTFVGKAGELIYTTDTKELFIHDGVTAGGTSVSASVADDSITFAKIEEIAGQTILGNNTGGSSDILELTPAQVRAIINVADGATANDSDANLKNRANHTGTQLAATISDFSTAVSTNTAVVANTAKVSYPSADATKVGFISVTQAVDLDTMESNIVTNNAKVSNATHTGEVTGSTTLTIANGVVDSDNLSTTLDFGSIA